MSTLLELLKNTPTNEKNATPFMAAVFDLILGDDADDGINPCELADLGDETYTDSDGSIWSLSVVDEEGGYEGGGDYAEKVFEFKCNGDPIAYVRVTGFYSSYEGTDWGDNWEFVVPREVMVIQYFAIDGSEDK